MLFAKIDQGNVLKNMILGAGALVDETRIVATEAGIKLTAMDESHIAILAITMPKDVFSEYKLELPEGIPEESLGVNLDDLGKVFKRVTAETDITLIHETDGEKIKVKVGGTAKRTFSIRLVDVDEDKIPPVSEIDVDFLNKITLPVTQIVEAIKDAELYADCLTTEITKKGVKFSAEGEIGDVEYEIPNEALPDATITKKSNGTYSLSFLKNILVKPDYGDNVTIDQGNDTPVKFSFNVPVYGDAPPEGGEAPLKGNVTIRVFLAPRVEEEEENATD